jgi:ribosomal protein S18 acetylase RimI-like enzyme
MITIRRMQNSEIGRIAEIDRSQHVTKAYSVNRDGSLEPKDVDWHIPPWSMQGQHDHTVRAYIEGSQLILDCGGVLFGAFDGEPLVGFAIYRPDLSHNTAQFAYLYVSNNYRNQGIGSKLTQRVIHLAKEDGAKRLYVSATPSAPTVDFYRSHGFEVTQEIDQQLYELEPEDIHMDKTL